MEQPLINQNPKEINCNNGSQKSISSLDNQFKDQVSNQQNHLCKMPLNINPPPQEYNLSKNLKLSLVQTNNEPQNSNNISTQQLFLEQDDLNLISKPNDKPQNQGDPQEQPYYPPQNTIIDSFKNNPHHQVITIPKKQKIPKNNNKAPQTTNLIFQNTPQNQDKNFQNYTNISQVPHKSIYQKNENIFYISTGCCFKMSPLIPIGILIFLIISNIKNIKDSIFLIIFFFNSYFN